MTFPYEHFLGTKLWVTVEDAVRELAENHDLEVTTDARYVVGYLCEQLVKASVAHTEAPSLSASPR